jgi:hypothetical protein
MGSLQLAETTAPFLGKRLAGGLARRFRRESTAAGKPAR